MGELPIAEEAFAPSLAKDFDVTLTRKTGAEAYGMKMVKYNDGYRLINSIGHVGLIAEWNKKHMNEPKSVVQEGDIIVAVNGCTGFSAMQNELQKESVTLSIRRGGPKQLVVEEPPAQEELPQVSRMPEPPPELVCVAPEPKEMATIEDVELKEMAIAEDVKTNEMETDATAEVTIAENLGESVIVEFAVEGSEEKQPPETKTTCELGVCGM
eukprot:TRINITY_DN68020_c0_g1_i1.p2 TRINITY_DN68020_c0_g1~~TRINITY_DN68020_c0_g1_i1.p2  ORF type:complete len:212 (-),score=30.53 TRINITY_DN68020_c0_g1_i1:325-960(-)